MDSTEELRNCQATMAPEVDNLLVSAMLDLGEVLLRAGGEVNRVEDTIRRIGHAYGCTRVEIFTINNMIALTVHDSGEGIITQTRRITSTAVDLEKVAAANTLSREVCANPLPARELKKRVEDIEKNTPHYKGWVTFLAYLTVAASCTVFFGGGVKEALASAVASQILCCTVRLCTRLKIQPIIAYLLEAFAMALAVTGLTVIGTWATFDKVIMGNIMLLIPGLGLTTSIRDLITGDTISGLMGICDALLKAFAIAVGCAAVILLTGIA